jgi:hypothetical protein
MCVGQSFAAKIWHRIGLAPNHIVQQPIALILKHRTHTKNVVIRSDHPNRAIWLEQPFGRRVAGERIARVRRFDASALEITGSKRSEPRVPFGQVVERGMLRPGEELFSIGNRFKVKVRADGTLIGNDVKGSIHQVGATLEGAPSCNGWTYWHFKRDGKMIPIDILRQQIRAEMEADLGRPH